MARPRGFDREEVLDRAVELFWTHGYDRTSVQDLVDSMGIQRGSLYAAFGDKHQLFLEALDRYEERFYQSMRELMSASDSPEEGIRRVFEAVLVDCACDDGTKGCFITNAAVALADSDPDTAARVRSNLGRVEETFFEALSPVRADARALARFLTNSFQGLRVLSKCCVDHGILRDAVEVTLLVLKRSDQGANSAEKGDPSNG
jgi:TetR/AcrR family transcriptional repressor of nem operon